MGKMRVRYMGLSDVRILEAEQLAADHSVNIADDLVWHHGNGWALDIEVNDRLEAILREQGTFRLEKLTDDGRLATEAAEEPAAADDMTGGTVRPG